MAALALITAACFAAVAISGQVDRADSDPPPPGRAAVTISPTAITTPVPRSFFGLSTEYWAIPLYARHVGLLERVISMLHIRGDGRTVLRIGGDSANRSFWDAHHLRLPTWAYGLTPRWTTLASRVVRRLRVRLIIDLNLITDTAAGATRWARVAESRLPRHSIIGFEVGNEPDVYRLPAWQLITSERMVGDYALPPAVTANDYAAQFQRVAATLRQVAPHVPLLGPELANPRAHVDWLGVLLADRPPGLGTVTIHRYVFSGCVGPKSPRYPTIAKLLRPKSSLGMAASLAQPIAIAHAAGLPIRLTEMNSVNCGGRAGVSNTFATALWAPDTLFNLLRAGVDGVAIHVGPGNVNAAYAFNQDGVVVRPLFYGLLMFVRTMGWRPRLVPLHLSAAARLNAAAWAVRTGTGWLHVLLIDKGRRPVRFRLSLPAHGPATVHRLLAPSVRSLSGVQLDGQHLGPNGTWLGRRQTTQVSRTRRGYVVTLSRFSESLITIKLDKDALARVAPRSV